MTKAIDENDGLTIGAQDSQSAMADHLIELPDNHFGLWRSACLRGAGFPAHLVGELAGSMCATVADQLLSLEKDIGEKRSAAIAAIRHDLEQCHDPNEQRKLFHALNQLKKNKPTPSLDSPCEVLRRRYWEAYTSRAVVESKYREEFEADIVALSEKFRKIVADPNFQQAMLLQNRAALHRTNNSLLFIGQEKARRKKKQEELVAKYLQRYCVKNESIGFFGPLGWFKFNSQRESIMARPGPGLIKESTLYFEQWCIEALAEKLEEDHSLREWMAPRRLPTFHLEGDKLSFPGGASITLNPIQSSVLKRCGGEQTAREIATELLETPASGVGSRNDVYESLKEFVRRGIITWKFELPWFHPERSLRKLLNRIEAEEKRKTALAMLDELEQAKDRVEAAFGNAAESDAQMGALEDTFIRLTGRSTTRKEGQMYAGRTLIYQECVRDIEMEIGSEIVREICAPLSLILTAARWFTHETAVVVREKCRKIYYDALRKSTRPYVELIPFWLEMQTLLEPTGPLFQRICEVMQARWRKILRPPQDSRRISYSSGELKKAVEETFAAPRCGWQTGRYHSPDVMIAASSLEAIQRGDYFLVLGELHIANNTLRAGFIEHPFPEEMLDAIERDMPPGQIFTEPSRSWPGATARNSTSLTSKYNYHLEASRDSLSTGPRSKTLPISAFVVRDLAEGLMVQTRDGRLKFEIIEFFGEMLSWGALNNMKIMPPRSHIPRVTFDKLVVQREQWLCNAADMAFAQKGEEAIRFLEARRWMHEQQMPRFVFARAHLEEKPFYIDFESPVYVEILVKLARRVLASDKPNAPIVISEMLPTHDHLWLTDNSGHKYTSELRIVIIDRDGNDAI